MRRHISQREARQAIKRVAELEQQRDALFYQWSSSVPGVRLGTLSIPRDWFSGRLEAAMLLGRAIVVKPYDGAHCAEKLIFYAVKP